MLKCDLHLHSFRSPDCNMSLDTIIRTCLRRGINCIAITDHNSFGSARELQRLAPFPVIPGEEIKTTEGEIIGLFLTDEIPRGMSPGATVEEIRSQGGIVYIPHPFDRVRRGRISPGALTEIMDSVDIIETYNSRISFIQDVEKAERYALEHHKLQGAGSDAHIWLELGHSHIQIPEFEGSHGFLKSMAQGRIHGKLSWPYVHVASSLIKWRNRHWHQP